MLSSLEILDDRYHSIFSRPIFSLSLSPSLSLSLSLIPSFLPPLWNYHRVSRCWLASSPFFHELLVRISKPSVAQLSDPSRRTAVACRGGRYTWPHLEQRNTTACALSPVVAVWLQGRSYDPIILCHSSCFPVPGELFMSHQPSRVLSFRLPIPSPIRRDFEIVR